MNCDTVGQILLEGCVRALARTRSWDCISPFEEHKNNLSSRAVGIITSKMSEKNHNECIEEESAILRS
ncbi:hypothetical protein R1flu_003509 [Riccia fluitans]|uniref:Uncharacterized protein n=1 Tax=Riccia fluitans TaxID=41844 RepID=A0ABD1YA70_9MARC